MKPGSLLRAPRVRAPSRGKRGAAADTCNYPRWWRPSSSETMEEPWKPAGVTGAQQPEQPALPRAFKAPFPPFAAAPNSPPLQQIRANSQPFPPSLFQQGD